MQGAGALDGLEAVVGAEFAADVGYMTLDRAGGENQLPGNLAVG